MACVTPAPGLSWRDALLDSLGSLGPWAPAVFIAIFVAACVLCVPVVFLTMASGALFGVVRGFLIAWCAAQIGAALSFVIGRHLARNRVQAALRRRRWPAALESAVSSQGWRIVVLARLAPGSPFFLLNYLFGVTRIRFLPYLLATSASIVPGTLMFVYLGAVGEKAVTGGLADAGQMAIHVAGVVAGVIGSILIGRSARRALSEIDATGRPEGMPGDHGKP